MRGRLGIRIKAAVSALSSLFGSNTTGMTTRPSFWGMVAEPFTGAWQRGMSVDSLADITAFGAVYACINRRATDIAKMRPRLVAQQDDGTWREVRSQSPFWPVLRKPNHYQNRIQFFTAWMISKLIHGNTYALKVRDARGIVVSLYILDPRRVTPLVTPEGDVYYSLGNDDLARINGGVVVPAREIIHDRAVTLFHPLMGVSPLYACAIAATQGRRIQGNSSQFFANMSRPSGMLTAPGIISQETADRLKKHWEENYSGDNLGRLAVLGDGLKYEAMTIPPEQAQMMQQLDWTVEDVARALGMPLYKINVGPVPTNNNVQALEQQYYTGTLQIDIESIELCLDDGLSLPPDLGTEFDLDGLLRMDTATLVDTLVKAVGGAIMPPNEAMARLNLPPVPGGNTVYLQQQYYSLEALSKRDAMADPFVKVAPVAPIAPSMPPPEQPIDAGKGVVSPLSLRAIEAMANAATRKAFQQTELAT
jgi:HK97 family phage portal protein